MQVPLLDLKGQYNPLREEILAEIAAICDAQQFVLGAKVTTLENELATYCQVPHTVGVTSGSDALIIALMAEKIGFGDEVITTPFTFFATAGAIARVGAKPVFVDIDKDSFNIDPTAIEAKITPRTRAIIPVHLFGQCADMDAIMAIARKHNLIVIEDACQSIGSEYKGHRAGSIGDYGAFSFFPSKNLGCFGDGGLVSTLTDERDGKLRSLRNHGQSATYIHTEVGGNFRLDALQAAILSIKLRHLDSWSDARQKNADEYREMFAASGVLDNIVLPEVMPYATRHIYNQYTIRVLNGRRDELKAFLLKNNIGCAVYYPLCLHEQDCFANLGGKAGDCPVAEQAAKEVLSLPIYPESTTEMRHAVVAAIKEFFGK